jgi:predicted transcriptional regulator of viral defense system
MERGWMRRVGHGVYLVGPVHADPRRQLAGEPEAVIALIAAALSAARSA